jgi:hypothetical protein
MPHDRQDLKQSMGHLWQGFASETLEDWMRAAGLQGFRYTPLPPDTGAKGPLLFAASGTRSAAAQRKASPRGKADSAPLMKSA